MKRKRPNAYSAVPSGGGKKKAKSVQALVKREVRKLQDLKGVDLAFTSGQLLSTTGTNADIWIMNAVDLGTGHYKREDAVIHGKSIRVKCIVYCNYQHSSLTGDIQGTTVRLALVWDRKPEGASIPNYDDIFNTIEKAGTTGSTTIASLNPNETHRFQILRDLQIEMNPSTSNNKGIAGDWVLLQKFVDIYVDLKGRKTGYTRNTATSNFADFQEGIIYLVARASTSGIHTVPTVVVNSRYRFVED